MQDIIFSRSSDTRLYQLTHATDITGLAACTRTLAEAAAHQDYV